MDPERKYETIAAALRAEITTAEPRGRGLPSERALTRRFDVDRSTVRRALELLEADGLITRTPRRRAEVLPAGPEDARREPRQVAFLVNASPRGLATLPMLQGMEAVFTPLGYQISLYSTSADDPADAALRERERLEFCLSRPVAGIVLWPASPSANTGLIREVAAAGIPVVLVDQRLPDLELDFAGIDNEAAAWSVTHHLIAAGHRRIAHFTRPNAMPTTLQRIEGYCRALREHGVPVPEHWVVQCAAEQEEAALDRLLAAEERPTALFAINDVSALRLLHHLVRRDIRVPGEMAVAGIDDLPVGELAIVPLTTLHQPFEEIGAAAARLLRARMEGATPAVPQVRLLPTRLVARASTAGPPLSARNRPYCPEPAIRTHPNQLQPAAS